MNQQFSIILSTGGTIIITDGETIPGLTVGEFNIELPDPAPRRRGLPMWVRRRDAEMEGRYIGFMADDAPEMEMPEHRAIMTPPAHLEGIFALAEHLGEGQDTVQRRVEVPGLLYGMDLGQHLVPKTTGLTNLEKIIFYEAGTTAQGDPLLPHQVRAPRAWYQHAGGIRRRYGCSQADAELLAESFRIIGVTDKMAATFDKWLATPNKFAQGVKYFERLASELVLVTDEGEPKLDLINYDDTDADADADTDTPAETTTIQAEGWHLLDDPRDEATSWFDMQPAAFRAVVTTIRKAAAKDLPAIGKALFIEKRFTKTQMSVIWDEYHRAKDRTAPKLRPLATKVLARIADQNANLNKAAAWLYGDGKKNFTQHELSVLWKALKDRRPKKQAVAPYEQIDLDAYIASML